MNHTMMRVVVCAVVFHQWQLIRRAFHLLLFSVRQQGSIHCIVAGTVGTWWYSPDECGCCSSAIHNSIIRTLTTSFGSICFGSLLVAIVQALRSLADQAQQNGDAQFIACIAECILACLASIIDYFNKVCARMLVSVFAEPTIHQQCLKYVLW